MSIPRNKIAVVTGASSGIGLAIASFLHSHGYKVYGVSRTYPPVDYEFEYLLCDLADPEAIESVYSRFLTKENHVDILVNCAGMGIGGAIEETPVDDYDRIFQVNVKGLFLFTKAMLPLIRQAENAKIFNIGSVAGSLVLPFQAFYSMTKASVAAFSEALRNELRPFGIQVTTILPGDTKTGFTANRIKNEIVESSLYRERQLHSLKKMETDEISGKSPDSVAKVIYRLAGRKSLPVSYTVGCEYKLFLFLQRILPKRLVNWILFQMYGK